MHSSGNGRSSGTVLPTKFCELSVDIPVGFIVIKICTPANLKNRRDVVRGEDDGGISYEMNSRVCPSPRRQQVGSEDRFNRPSTYVALRWRPIFRINFKRLEENQETARALIGMNFKTKKMHWRRKLTF